MNCRQALNQGLHAALSSDPKVVLLGEDILDPYGGAFKVTQGLSSRWPDRVFSTPISEAASTGVAIGLALAGFRPVLEIMFGDFLTLCVDQLTNHAAKFNGMYAGKVRVPMMVRTPMGGRRGYGPTHSQSLETLLLGVDGLRILSANEVLPLDTLLCETILGMDGPVLLLENKAMYGRDCLASDDARMGVFSIRRGPHLWDRTASTCGFRRADLTIAVHGGMVPIGLEAARELALEDEIFAEVAIVGQLQPFDESWIAESARRSGALLVAEESQGSWGWGSELVARIAQSSPGTGFARVASKPGIVPASKTAEEKTLPQVRDIVEAARALKGGGR